MDALPVYLYCTSKGDRLDRNAKVAACARDYARRLQMLLPEELNVRRDNGKPSFQNAERICFSVSHSGSVWAVAFASQPLGLDIQRHSECNQSGIARRFFHAGELEHLEKNSYADFFDIWSAKESYVKFTGRGIDDDFCAFCVVENGELVEQMRGVRFYHVPLLPSYSACICGEAELTICTVINS
jgi:phosphopantetheinyl transferase